MQEIEVSVITDAQGRIVSVARAAKREMPEPDRTRLRHYNDVGPDEPMPPAVIFDAV